MALDAFYPGLDVEVIDAAGQEAMYLSDDIEFFNITQNVLIDTIATNSEGVLEAGGFDSAIDDAAVGDVVELRHATYPGTARLTLQATPELATLAVENHVATLVLENNYATRVPDAVALYAEDLNEPGAKPIFVGNARVDGTTLIPFQTGVAKNYRFYAASSHKDFQVSAAALEQLPSFDLNLPGAGLAVGSAITGGGNNRVLHQGATGLLATDANFQFQAGKLGIGLSTTPDGKLHVRSTVSPQLQLDYDASNKLTVSVGSTGEVNFEGAGSASAFRFKKLAVAAINAPNADLTNYLTLRNEAGGFGSWGFAKYDSNDLVIVKQVGTDTPSTVALWLRYDTGRLIVNSTSDNGNSLQIGGSGSFAGKLVTESDQGNTSTYNYLTFRNLASGYGTWGFAKYNSNDLALMRGSNTYDPGTLGALWEFDGKFSLFYDGSNSGKWSIGSTGVNTFLAVGSGAKFVFSNDVDFSGHLTIADGKNINLGTTTGTKIGMSKNEKLGFFDTAPVTQPNANGVVLGHTAGVGGTVRDTSTFTGDVGLTAYTIGDIVAALKGLGLIDT